MSDAVERRRVAGWRRSWDLAAKLGVGTAPCPFHFPGPLCENPDSCSHPSAAESDLRGGFERSQV